MYTKIAASKNADQLGFTLVELSIVIIIIGLLISGIMAGRSLITQSKMQAVIREISTYDIALANFVNYYKELPGDMVNGYGYWGTIATSNCVNADINVNTQGCNGNGDGFINWTNEGYKFWQHLSLSKMIRGNYNGDPNGSIAISGINVPASVMDNACYSVETNNGIYYGLNGHILELGATNATTCLVPVILAEDMLLLDQRIDDGLPLSGKVRPRLDNDVSCTVAGTHAAYNLSSPGNVCTLAYLYSTPR